MKAARYFPTVPAVADGSHEREAAAGVDGDEVAAAAQTRQRDWRLNGSLKFPAGFNPFGPLPASWGKVNESNNPNDLNNRRDGSSSMQRLLHASEGTEAAGKRPRSSDSDGKLPVGKISLDGGGGGRQGTFDEHANNNEEDYRKRRRYTHMKHNDERRVVRRLEYNTAVTIESERENARRHMQKDGNNNSRDAAHRHAHRQQSQYRGRRTRRSFNYDNYYCDVCDRYMRTIGEKYAHNQSRSHARRMAELEAGEAGDLKQGGKEHNKTVVHKTFNGQGKHDKHAEKEEECVLVASLPPQTSNNTWDDGLVSEVDAFMASELHTIGNAHVPDSFKSWANKSIAAASADGNVARIALVRKEVTFELLRGRNQCTLFRVNWDRRALASGDMMKNGRIALPTVKRVPVSQLMDIHMHTDGPKSHTKNTVKEETKMEQTIVKKEELLVNL